MAEAFHAMTTVKTEMKSDGNVNIIKMKIEDQDGNTTTITVKRNTPMQKIMNAFCNNKGVDINSFKVLIDGKSINLEHTPAKLEMTEEDIVYICLHTDGG